jgi:hypothetical protein
MADEPEVVGCTPPEAEVPVAGDVPAEPAVAPEDGIGAPLVAVAPAGWVVELPAAPDDCVIAPDEPPADEPCVGAGCMAGEPDVVVPVPEAVGRSVAAEGAVWASAGAATNTVAIRQAAICVLSMLFSCKERNGVCANSAFGQRRRLHPVPIIFVDEVTRQVKPAYSQK